MITFGLHRNGHYLRREREECFCSRIPFLGFLQLLGIPEPSIVIKCSKVLDLSRVENKRAWYRERRRDGDGGDRRDRRRGRGDVHCIIISSGGKWSGGGGRNRFWHAVLSCWYIRS